MLQEQLLLDAYCHFCLCSGDLTAEKPELVCALSVQLPPDSQYFLQLGKTYH